MEKQKLPETKTYTQLPVEVRAHQLAKGDRLGDVMWSGFFLGAAVMVTDLDQYNVPRTKQVIAQEGDYLIWRQDNKGWERVVKREEFERTHESSGQP